MSAGVGQVDLSLLQIGSQFGGYRVGPVLGRQSGIGRVYEASRLETADRVALKVFRSPELAAPSQRSFFARSIEAQERLEHPNVVSVTEWGFDPAPYLVMSLVRGTTLAEHLANGSLGERRVLEILAAVGEGLDAGRRQGLVYRRLQPSSILLSEEGAVFLGDFGAARWARGTELIGTGRLGRFADYMSPEEVDDGDPTPASAVYSLGAIAFEALAGRAPFASEHQGETLQAHLTAPPRGPGSVRPELPRSLDRVIARALSKDPALRQQSAAELMHDVIRACPDVRTPMQRSRTPDLGSKTPRRRLRFGVATAAVAAVAGAAALGAIAAGGDEPQQGPVVAKRVATRDLELRHPADWRVSRQAPELAGLALADPVALAPAAGTGGELLVGRLERGGLPRGSDLVDLGAVIARRYRTLRVAGSRRRVVAIAIPSATGPVVAACIGPVRGAFASRCQRVASTVRPRREGVALAAASPGYARALSATVRRLDRVRVKRAAATCVRPGLRQASDG